MAVISKEDWVKLKNKVSKLNYLVHYISWNLCLVYFTFYQFKLIAHHIQSYIKQG